MQPSPGSIFTRKRELYFCALAICTFVLLWQMGFVSRAGFRIENPSPSSLWEEDEEKVKDKDQKISPEQEKIYTSNDIQSLDQLNKRLWYYTRSHFIYLPSVLEYSFGANADLRFLDPEVDSVVYPMFKHKRDGFFVEVGAYDGISSHTLILERDFGWNGLLIECNPELVPKLKSVNRKAYIADVCLSTTTHPVKARMTSMDNWLSASSLGSGNLYPNITSNFTTFEVQTIPLYAILASIDVTQVDLLVLDVQSLELEVIKHFPFELVQVKVWVIETYFYSDDQKTWLVNFMESKGYPKERVVRLTNDFVFCHNTLNL